VQAGCRRHLCDFVRHAPFVVEQELAWSRKSKTAEVVSLGGLFVGDRFA